MRLNWSRQAILPRSPTKNFRIEKYAQTLSTIIGNLADSCQNDFVNDFVTPHKKVKVIGLVVVATDRGLCGNLNTLLFRQVIETMQEAKKKEPWCGHLYHRKQGLRLFSQKRSTDS